jgi:hypothetical protein
MTTQVQTPFNSYTGNGSVKAFPYTFQIGVNADLKVYVNGIVQATGYSVSGAGNSAGGTVTFVTAPVLNALVYIKRVTSLDRNTDYTEGAALSSTTLDSDIDRVVRQIQDLDAGVVRYNLNDSNIELDGSRITGAGEPVNDQDYATRYFVEHLSGAATEATLNARDAAIAAAASASSTLANTVVKTGSTMTGPLILNADPSNVLGATTKQYVDGIASTLTTSINTNDSNQTTAVNAAVTNAVQKAGSTMTGLLVLSADPSAALGAATKQYVDAAKTSAINTATTSAVQKAGSTMTGSLILNADPSAALGAATKQYVDTWLTSSTGTALTLSTSTQAAPASGNGVLYANNLAGRIVPTWRGPEGSEYSFQPSLSQSRVCLITASGAVPSSFGMVVTTVGTLSAPSLSNANLRSSMRRLTITSAATAGAFASAYSPNYECWRGDAAGLGGFLFTQRFATNTLVAGNRFFTGLSEQVVAPTNVDPVTLTSVARIGLAVNTNTGNWNLVHTQGGIGINVIPLGASFPLNTTDVMEFTLYAKPNDTVVQYVVTNVSTGATTSGSLSSSNIPTSTTFLAPVAWMTNNATASAVAWNLMQWYLETDY